MNNSPMSIKNVLCYPKNIHTTNPPFYKNVIYELYIVDFFLDKKISAYFEDFVRMIAMWFE